MSRKKKQRPEALDMLGLKLSARPGDLIEVQFLTDCFIRGQRGFHTTGIFLGTQGRTLDLMCTDGTRGVFSWDLIAYGRIHSTVEAAVG